MAIFEGRQTVAAAVILGVLVAGGLTAGGYYIGKGAARFKSDARTVTVKGLVDVVTTSLVVKTDKVDLVQASLGATEELLKVGVALDSSEGGGANPRYVVSKFNELRPQLLAEATKNARAIAQQFAADSGAQVGGIRSANQGMIQIFGLDGGDESGPFSPTSTPVKKIRVVSTFEFDLK